LKVFVTAYEPNAHLLDNFHKLVDRFWGVKIIVDIAPIGENKSEQLRRLFRDEPDEYFVLLEEDFWFVDYVPLKLVKQVFQFCTDNHIGRFSLQSKNAYRSNNWPLANSEIGAHPVYRTKNKAVAVIGLDASVWRFLTPSSSTVPIGYGVVGVLYFACF